MNEAFRPMIDLGQGAMRIIVAVFNAAAGLQRLGEINDRGPGKTGEIGAAIGAIAVLDPLAFHSPFDGSHDRLPMIVFLSRLWADYSILSIPLQAACRSSLHRPAPGKHAG